VNASDHRPNGDPVNRPTPREINALKAVADGASFAMAARDLGIPLGTFADTMSSLYRRLGIPRMDSRARRALAVQRGRREGWWTE
jgi:DNA-binding NarL/FixJ family response regulator